ncbi:MAG: hypothetical protein Q7S84_04090 [bacterium]|nr:hypothetical protein [bacterium]
MLFRTTWRAYLRRIRASSDATKRRWIAVVGLGSGGLVIALWVIYLSSTLPARLDSRSGGPTRTNTPPLATTTASESPQERRGDVFTNGVRGIRDMMAKQWQGARNTIDSSWQSLGALITEGNEFSVTGTTTPALPESSESSEPPHTP